MPLFLNPLQTKLNYFIISRLFYVRIEKYTIKGLNIIRLYHLILFIQKKKKTTQHDPLRASILTILSTTVKTRQKDSTKTSSPPLKKWKKKRKKTNHCPKSKSQIIPVNHTPCQNLLPLPLDWEISLTTRSRSRSIFPLPWPKSQPIYNKIYRRMSRAEESVRARVHSPIPLPPWAFKEGKRA